MPPADALHEFRTVWLPHATPAGVRRLAELLERASPLLIHGAFAKAVPLGCLASHIAWNHPATCGFNAEAGVMWLTRVAKLNPATSAVLLTWDRDGLSNLEFRSALLAACREEEARRTTAHVDTPAADREAEALAV